MDISPKWSKLAKAVLGDKSGRHCHWCKFIQSVEDGSEVHCSNKDSPFCDGDRIRTWDGQECASKCKVFELDEWYTQDENHEAYFKK